MNYPLLILSLFLCLSGSGQYRFELKNSIEAEFDFFTTDNLGNLYFVYGDEMDKYSLDGKLLYHYSDKSLGEISRVDFLYSLKPLLFYAGTSQLATLDNTLSLQGSSVNLLNAGLAQVTLMASSVNNHYWLYDQENIELVRTTFGLEPVTRSGNLTLLLNQTIVPDLLMEANNFVYLNSPDVGVLVFDLFGNYYKTIPITGITQFKIIDKRLYFLKNGSLSVYFLNTFLEEKITLPVTGSIIDFDINGKNLFLYNGIKLFHYEFVAK